MSSERPLRITHCKLRADPLHSHICLARIWCGYPGSESRERRLGDGRRHGRSREAVAFWWRCGQGRHVSLATEVTAGSSLTKSKTQPFKVIWPRAAITPSASSTAFNRPPPSAPF
jgi:hypothetical protein